MCRHRIRGGQGLPIEILNSCNRLISTARNLLGTILDYNRAQFALLVAVGSRPTTVCPLHRLGNNSASSVKNSPLIP